MKFVNGMAAGLVIACALVYLTQLSDVFADDEASLAPAAALTTAFTYQGRLEEDGLPANGIYAFDFQLFDGLSGLAGASAIVPKPNVQVTNGLFTVALDFGAAQFTGQQRFLEVRVGNGGPMAILGPRQELTPTPYAIFAQTAGSVDWDDLTNVPPGFADDVDDSAGAANAWLLTGNSGTLAGTSFLGTTDSIPLEIRVNNFTAFRFLPSTGTAGPNLLGGLFTNALVGVGTGGSIGGGSLNSIQGFTPAIGGGLGNSALGDFSFVGGGSNNHADEFGATVGGGEFNRAGTLGVTFNDAAHATVAGGLLNTAGGPRTFVGGGDGNLVFESGGMIGGGSNNLVGRTFGTIGGGRQHIVDDIYGSILGGRGNLVSGSFGTVAGGGMSGEDASTGNRVTAPYGFIGGGSDNVSGSSFGVIGGGRGNAVTGSNGTVGGGSGNSATGPGAVVAGGGENNAGENAFVGGGEFNTASGPYSVVAGGAANFVAGEFATVGGGGSAPASMIANKATDDYGVVAGGGSNQAGNGDINTTNAIGATVSGGNFNGATSEFATVGGGQNNVSTGAAATIGGGRDNSASATFTTVGGGDENLASASFATVAGGDGNTASGIESTVGGGDNNTAGGLASTVPGGRNNSAAGDFSFAGGQRAKISGTGDGSFAWADSQVADFSVTEANVFAIRASGGLRLDTADTHEVGIEGGAADINFNYRRKDDGTTVARISLDGTTVANNQDAAIRFYTRLDGFGLLSNLVLEANGDLRPGSNSTNASTGKQLGTASFNWREVHAFDVIETSDRRLKKNIVELVPGLGAVMKLRPVSFEWTESSDGDVRMGLIAQEVQQVLPGAVDVPEEADGYLGISYSELTPVLIKAIQEQQAQIDALTNGGSSFSATDAPNGSRWPTLALAFVLGALTVAIVSRRSGARTSRVVAP